MTGLFIIDMGAYLWLAIIEAAFVGLMLEPAKDGEPGELIVRRILAIAGIIICSSVIMEKVVNGWGLIALVTIITLTCGTSAATISHMLNRKRTRDQRIFFSTFSGGMTAVCVAILAYVVCASIVGRLDYEDYSYGTEIRDLEPLRSDAPNCLVEKHNDSENYTFKFVRKNGDILGSRRYLLDAKHVVFLDDDSADQTYVEGEVTTKAKIDPISGTPLETIYSKTFRPITLYVHSSDIWMGDIG